MKAKFSENCFYSFPDIPPGSLTALYIDIECSVVSFKVQVIPEGKQAGGLPTLPGSMKDEVLLLGDEGEDLSKVKP